MHVLGHVNTFHKFSKLNLVIINREQVIQEHYFNIYFTVSENY